MQINLGKRKNLFKENEVNLNLVISKDKKHLLVGCVNHGYHAYNVVNETYNYASKIDLKSLHDGYMFYNVKVKFDENENIFSFFNNENELLFTIEKDKQSIIVNDYSTNNDTFSLSVLEGHHQYFNYYGIIDDVYFKIDDVVYQLIKNNNEFDSLFPSELDDEYDEYESDFYDSAFIIKAINPPLNKFPEKPIDMVQIKYCREYSDGQKIEGTEIYSKKNNHVYVFAGKLSYDGEDCSSACYGINSEVEKKKKENSYKMSDDYWSYLTDFSDSTLGLKEGKDSGSAWVNEIINRLNGITDDEEAIRRMFAIQQKIGMTKVNTSYSYTEKYPSKLYKNLEKTLDILLKERFKK